MNRLTAVVLDGPGDEGFLIPRAAHADHDPALAGWDDAVDATREVVVIAGPLRLTAAVME